MELLKIYLAFSLAGAVVTYWTLVREAAMIYEEITGEKHSTEEMPVIAFIQWVPRAVVIAPLLLFGILTGQITKMRNVIAQEFLKNAGYND